MFEQDYLKYCLSEVEKKLNWEPSSLWKESDFIKLSQIISDTSGISISPHTLKRLFGKIKYKKFYNPQTATKDALSKFLGYSDWEHFVEQNKDKISKKAKNQTTSNTKPKRKKQLVVYVSLIIFIGFMASYYFCIQTNLSKHKTEHFTFILNDSIGKVPFTVPIHYNISSIVSDSVYIDFDLKNPYRGQQLLNLKKNGSVANFSYQIPGYYHIALKKGEDTLKTKNVLAMSDGWDSYFVNESKLGDFWLDNEVEQSRDSVGYLYFTTKDLISKGFDTSKVFYITNRLYKKFNIDGDNFEFETRFKNSKALGGITCYDFIIRLNCENNLNYLNLMESGCSQYSAIKFGESFLNGSQNNLSSFKIDPEKWNVLKVIVKEKHVDVFINNKLIFNGDYKQPNGNIIGIENVFKGSGMLDYIRIKDLKTSNEFFDDF